MCRKQCSRHWHNVDLLNDYFGYFGGMGPNLSDVARCMFFALPCIAEHVGRSVQFEEIFYRVIMVAECTCSLFVANFIPNFQRASHRHTVPTPRKNSTSFNRYPYRVLPAWNQLLPNEPDFSSFSLKSSLTPKRLLRYCKVCFIQFSSLY